MPTQFKESYQGGETVKFTAKLFVITSCQLEKGWGPKRGSDKTLRQYLSQIEKNGVHIVSAEKIKSDATGGRHDRYAKGDYYSIVGTATKSKTKKLTKFGIYHACRTNVDYWNSQPVLYGSIKLKL